MSIFDDAIAAALVDLGEALGEPAFPVPEGFGTDLAGTDDLTETMREVSGNTTLVQAIYRRLTTPRGALLDDPDYGLDLRTLLSRGMTPEDLAGLPDVIAAEIRKEQRIEACEVQVQSRADGAIEIAVRAEVAEGPFNLTITVTEAAVVLTEV